MGSGERGEGIDIIGTGQDGDRTEGRQDSMDE